MASTARSLKTPEEKKRAGIAMLLLAAVLLFAGIVAEYQSRNFIKQCSASVSGVVTEVSSKKVQSRKHRSSRTKYQAYIRLEDDFPFGINEIPSGWTETHYQTGDFIKVYYNPHQPSVYYAEGAEPQSGIVLMVFSVMFGVSGALFIKKGIAERRRIQDAAQQEW